MHIIDDDRHQPLLLFRVIDPRHRLNGAAQRSQRVFDFVRNIGGKSFDSVHALPQRLGHAAQIAGQFADFVAAAGKVGNFRMPSAARAHPLGSGGEAIDRPRDGAGQI